MGILYPSIAIEPGDVIIKDGSEFTVFDVDKTHIQARSEAGCYSAIKRAGIIEVSRLKPGQNYFQYRRKVWHVLLEFGVSKKSLPKSQFIKPLYLLQISEIECATLFLSQNESA